MQIRHSKMAGDTPAFPLISEGVNALIQDGFYSNRGGFPVGWNDRVIYAEQEDGEIIGVLCYQRIEHRNEFYVSLGYVEPSSRRQGVYKAMWDALEGEARKEGVSRIVGETHVRNLATQAVMQSLGRVLEGLTYVYSVDSKGKERQETGCQ